jgi:hypothetical protein
MACCLGCLSGCERARGRQSHVLPRFGAQRLGATSRPSRQRSPSSTSPWTKIDQAVDELTASCVPIQRYDGFETDDKGIYHADGHAIAWFTDPAGNVLSVVQMDA